MFTSIIVYSRRELPIRRGDITVNAMPSESRFTAAVSIKMLHCGLQLAVLFLNRLYQAEQANPATLRTADRSSLTTMDQERANLSDRSRSRSNTPLSAAIRNTLKRLGAKSGFRSTNS